MKVSAASSGPAATSSAPASSPPPTVDHFRLTGPSLPIDRRIHAARGDIADIALADRVFAPHYALPLLHGCIVPAVPVRDAPSGDGRAASELLLGENFAVVDVSGGWAWGFAAADHYVGYVPLGALGAPASPTHRVWLPAALVFSAPDIKAPVLARLPTGACVTVMAGVADGDFLALADGGFVHHRHVRPIHETETDPVTVAERMIGVPYRWGGRSGDGIDCSGLIQLAFASAGRAVPRDSDMQQAIGAPLAEGDALRRGDLIFWPGHVGIMADADLIVHANAHWMATVREPLADVAERNPDPIIARRRP